LNRVPPWCERRFHRLKDALRAAVLWEALLNQDGNRQRDGIGQRYELLSKGRMQCKTRIVKGGALA
jgi:hypothetical protein